MDPTQPQTQAFGFCLPTILAPRKKQDTGKPYKDFGVKMETKKGDMPGKGLPKVWGQGHWRAPPSPPEPQSTTLRIGGQETPRGQAFFH